MIGVSTDVPRCSVTVPLPPGALLCLYTDGLVEHRGEVLDDSLDRLRQAVTAGQPDACCVSVMRAMVGNEPARDGVVLLIFQCQQLT
jgi:serine phosphatase RsbU (regulator of sigma subunit)